MSDDEDQMVVIITEDAYNSLQESAKLEERQAILKWLRSANQPLMHTAWQFAKSIEQGEHWK